MRDIELQEIGPEIKSQKSVVTKNFDYLKDVDVSLEVRVGKVNLTVEELFSLKVGSVLSLDCLIEDPVDLLLKGRVVARGRLAVIDDYYGVEISEVEQ